MWLFLALAAGAGVAAAAKECESVTRNEVIVKGDVYDVLWQAEDHDNYVLLQTTEGFLYRSFSAGKTFDEENGRLPRSDEVISGSSGVMHMYRTAKPTHLYFLSYGSWMWVTKNLGKDYHLVEFPDDRHFYTLIPHPYEAEWAIGYASTDGCYYPYPEDIPCSRMAFVTQDMGATWTQVANYVQAASWGNAGYNGIKRETIYISYHEHDKDTESQSRLTWESVRLVKSTDFFRTETVLLESNVGGFIFFENRYMFVARLDDPDTNALGLVVSLDSGNHFTQSQFPSGLELQENRYTIVEASEHAAMVNVDHSTYYWGHLYISDSSGSDFTTSLLYNHREPWGHVDLSPLAGIEGVYFANSVSNPDETYSAAIEMESWISFDKGGVWVRLGEPLNDECDNLGACNLNLNVVKKRVGPSSHYETQTRVGPLYSKANAVGLVMATGKPGPYLLPNSQDINTYVSQDAGLTWTKVREGSHIYDFGDHGAIVVMALSEVETGDFVYSWNHGSTWQSCPFSDKDKNPIDVDSIISEPSGTGEGFLVYGSRINSDGASEGVVVHLDFGSLHERECRGATNPGSPDSDYEYFIPASSADGACILGHELAFIRRKPLSQCFNPEELEPVEVRRNCECTELDYECDVNYERVDGVCVPMAGTEDIDTKPDECPDSGYYEISNGYRKVPGDTCQGGVDHSPRRVKCGKKSGTGAGMITLYVFLSIALVGGAAFGGVFLHRQGLLAMPSFSMPSMPSMGGGGRGSRSGYSGVEADHLMNDFEDEDEENPVFRLG